MVALAMVPAWAPACMDAAEWALWEGANRGLNGSWRAARPCADCPIAHAADMRAEGRCNGTPEGVAEEPIEEDEVVEQVEAPVVVVPVEPEPPALEMDDRAEPGEEGAMATGPTERQQEAWDLVTTGGLTQIAAADRMRLSHAGLIYLLRAYQTKTGLTGPLPGRTNQLRTIRRVPAEALDAPATTSAPAPLEPATEASPSSVVRPTDEPIATPAPADPSPGAGDGDPSADGGLLHPSAGQIPGADGAGGMAPSAHPGSHAVDLSALGILEHECERLKARCADLAAQAERLQEQRMLVTEAHDAALRARDAYRALVGSGA